MWHRCTVGLQAEQLSPHGTVAQVHREFPSEGCITPRVVWCFQVIVQTSRVGGEEVRKKCSYFMYWCVFCALDDVTMGDPFCPDQLIQWDVHRARCEYSPAQNVVTWFPFTLSSVFPSVLSSFALIFLYFPFFLYIYITFCFFVSSFLSFFLCLPHLSYFVRVPFFNLFSFSTSSLLSLSLSRVSLSFRSLR